MVEGISDHNIETRVPEKNALEALDNLFSAVGALTGPSKTLGFERPLSLRAQRAHILKRGFPNFRPWILRKLSPKEDRQVTSPYKLISEAKARDEITRQYLNQKEIRVMINGAGEQMSRFVTLEPLTERKTERPQTPVVIVPGASNDIDCVGTLAQELALRGRKVTILGYPESFMGKVTPEFVEMIDRASTYEPHAEFYKKAINMIVPEGDFELWGYSNGGPIVELMLSEKNFGNRVKDAVIVCPANSVNQSLGEFIIGTIKELKHLMEEFKFLPRYSFTTGNKNLENKDHLKLRNKVLNIVLRRVLIEMNLWKDARVKDRGTITIVSGTEDEITKSYRKFNNSSEPDLRQKNPQLRVLVVPDSHAGVLIEPIPILDKIQEIQEV